MLLMHRNHQRPKRLRSADITGEMTWFQMPDSRGEPHRTRKTVYVDTVTDKVLVLDRVEQAALLDALRYRLSAPGPYTSETRAIAALLEKFMRL